MKIAVQWLMYPVQPVTTLAVPKPSMNAISIAFAEIEIPIGTAPDATDEQAFSGFVRDAAVHGIFLSPFDWIAPSEIKRIVKQPDMPAGATK
jgi:hypothetical protein